MKLEEIAIFTDQVKATTAFYQTLGSKIVYQNEGMAIVAFDNVKMLIHARYEPGKASFPARIISLLEHRMWMRKSNE